jgi:hypothetical protein
MRWRAGASLRHPIIIHKGVCLSQPQAEGREAVMLENVRAGALGKRRAKRRRCGKPGQARGESVRRRLHEFG